MERVFLIGDSIRQGYDRYVRESLSGEAEVYYPQDNCRFAAYTLRHVGDWIEREVKPESVTCIHFNCGLWDTGFYYPENEPFTPLEVYCMYMRRLVNKLRILCPQAKLIFATSTPVQENRYDVTKFRRPNSVIVRYNEAAAAIMREMQVAIDDLHAAASALDESAWSDGTHLYTEIGTRTLGESVVRSIRDALNLHG